jgi:hypothetical protein
MTGGTPAWGEDQSQGHLIEVSASYSGVFSKVGLVLGVVDRVQDGAEGTASGRLFVSGVREASEQPLARINSPARRAESGTRIPVTPIEDCCAAAPRGSVRT